MRHIEFINGDHFEHNYFRSPPPPALLHFIEFFWETRFDSLWKEYPGGFSDAQFPNTGYTYIINLGTPFVMQVSNQKFNTKSDCFLPRYNTIECFHQPGNHLFGIKFRISPILFEKKINFSEYKESIFPLSYLLDSKIVSGIKQASSFEERSGILSEYFFRMLTKHEGSLQPVNIVSNLLEHCFQQNDFSISLEDVAAKNQISLRTLQRYFQICTGISGKKALQVMRIRKAVAHIISSPENFDHSIYGYYDHSHFYKHLRYFLKKTALKNLQQHLKLSKSLQK